MFRAPVIACALCLAALPAFGAAPACWDYAAGGWDAVGRIPGLDPVGPVAVTADGRLLGGFPAGVGIFDLTDPAAPVFNGFLATDAPVVRLAASGDRCLALTGTGVLWYGLLTAGEAPVWGDSLLVDGQVDRIGLDRGTAAVVLAGQALLAIDVSDPKRLEFGGFVVPPVGILDLVLDRGLAYVGTQLDRFYVYDVSDPAHVVFVGSPREGLASGTALAVRYPTVYAAATRSIYTYDVSNPAAPLPTGRSDVIATSISGIAAGKDGVFALTRSEQAVLFRDEGPGQLRLVGHAALPAQGRALTALGDHLYAGLEAADGVVLDVRDARHPGFDRQDLDWKIEVQDLAGERAYAITSDGFDHRRLEVLDFDGDQDLLTRRGTLPIAGTAVALDASGPLVAFATNVTDLTLVDAADPAAPRYLGIASTQTFPRGLLLIGQGAYVATNSLGLVGYDIRDPTRPLAVGQATIPRTQVAWSQLGDYALVGMTGDLNGMFVVDCHEPADVRIVAWVSLAADVADVRGAQNHAYVADRQGQVHVFDLTDPTDPRPRGALTVGEGAGQLAAFGRHVYYVDAKQGVVVLDAIAPDQPRILGRSLVPLEWTSLHARATGLYLPVGLTVSRLPLPCDALAAAPPRAPGLPALTAAPNPFNPRTTLSFSLAAAAPCRLEIFDLRGRRVAVVADGAVLPPGLHRFAWDGRDAGGRAMASGRYIARLEAGPLRTGVGLTLVR